MAYTSVWHWPVYVLARWTTGLTVWPFNAGAVALSFLLAAASYRVVEQPFRRSAWPKAQPLGLRIGLCLVLMAAGWLSGRVLLDLQPKLGLGKVTREAADWYGSRHLVKTELASSRQCEPLAEPVAIGSRLDAGTRYDPRGCPRRLASHRFVIGDSHALAYQPMLEQLSAETGRTVTLLPTLGCSYLDMREALTESTDPQCYRVAREVLRTVLDHARPGDIVFLPSLRLPRLVELGGARRQAVTGASGLQGDPFERTAQELEALGQAVADAPRWIEPFSRQGCGSCWRRRNRSSGHTLLPALSSGTDGIRNAPQGWRSVASTWRAIAPPSCTRSTCWQRDIPASRFGIRCPCCVTKRPAAPCGGDRPMFFDADHLSPYGNLVLLPAFREALRQVEMP